MRRPYSSYRHSGVEWLGDIPEHWEVKRLERVASYRTSSVDKKTHDGEQAVKLCNYTDVYYRDRIRASDADFMEATASPHEIARFGLSVGDVLITKDSEDWTDIAVPALVEESADDFVCGYHLGIIRPGALADATFIFRAMQSEAVNRQLQVASSGVTRYGLPSGAVSKVSISLPPLDEQRSIAAFLDAETAKIDTLVAKNRLLLDRLAEYRTALITRTVTKGLPPEAARESGLNPNPPLKPSGVEWIGEVPEHWAVRPFRRVLQESLKYGVNEAADLDDPDLPRFVRITDIANNRHLRDETFRSLPIHVAAPYLLEDGDLLFARSGATFGQTFLYNESLGPCAYAGYLIRARLDTALAIPEFISYFSASHSYASWLQTEVIQATIENVNAERYSRMPLPLPPIGEQQAIISFLDRQTGRMDALSARVEAAIERLQEYRTALITAAVTGKIDVREHDAVEIGVSST